jgi:tRNA threonylcarbamoyl adenosine modification protein YeaZ
VLTLVIDSATSAITAALGQVTGNGAEIVAEQVTVDARAHGELLAPAVDTVLRKGGVGPSDLSAVVVGVGPGPFTGLRVGLVTAAALADTLNLPLYGVCTLDALARSVPGRLLVATDARRKEIYWAGYADGVRQTGPSVNRPADVSTVDYECAVGDGALRYAELLNLPVRDEPRYPPAIGLLSLAARRILDRAPNETPAPLYLRRPDAVEPVARNPFRSGGEHIRAVGS